MKTLLTGTALVISMTAAANAAQVPRGSDVLAGGPLYSANGSTVICEFINFGTTMVTPTSQQIFAYGSTTALTLTGSSCANGTSVAPYQTCYIIIRGTPNEPLSCTVAFSGVTTHIRGALQLYDSSSNTLSATELR